VILQLDIGNTRVKWRLCDGTGVQDRGVLARSTGELLPELKTAPQQAWIASVAGAASETELAEAVGQRWDVQAWFAHTSATACGVTNSYEEPVRMGVDRWLAMLAAWNDARAPVCVIDAGSALTIDFVSADGQHRGGYIVPGLDSMERALLQDTDRVRFGDAARDSIEPGRSTEEAVFNGLQLSQAGAVALALQRFGDGSSLYFCGGNAAQLQTLVNAGGELDPDLVFKGLALLADEELGTDE
jgi:type III pantothenate kinase